MKIICLTNTFQVLEILFSVQEATKGQKAAEQANYSQNGAIEAFPLLGSLNPGHFADINIAVDCNTNWYKTVEKAYKENILRPVLDAK
jgi:hypothetical protein